VVVVIVNILAVVISPIVAVYIGRWLQERSEKRKEKWIILKTLMSSRDVWNQESVYALNIIDIVFSDDEKVVKCWREYYDKVCIDSLTDNDNRKINNAKFKLLEAMAASLGYGDKITWESIQNPYKLKWMVDEEKLRKDFQISQIKITNKINEFMSEDNHEKTLSQ